MPFGFDCEFRSFTSCMNHNRDKLDPGAYCGWLRKKTERKCLSPLASLRVPADITSPGAALSARHEWEVHAVSLADEAVADFLVHVEMQAREALSASVLLAASPFSRAGVRSLWRRLTQRHPVMEELPEDEFAEAAYEETAAVLQTAARPMADAAPVSDRLTTALVYEGDTAWQARTAKAARTLATRLYNETAEASLAAQGYERKRWVSRRDEDTRPSHREADGQTIMVYESFRVGDALLAYPGDATGPPGEVYNCRCVIVGAAG